MHHLHWTRQHDRSERHSPSVVVGLLPLSETVSYIFSNWRRGSELGVKKIEKRCRHKDPVYHAYKRTHAGLGSYRHLLEAAIVILSEDSTVNVDIKFDDNREDPRPQITSLKWRYEEATFCATSFCLRSFLKVQCQTMPLVNAPASLRETR